MSQKQIVVRYWMSITNFDLEANIMEVDWTMFSEFIDVIQSFLTEPAILIGLLVGLGYALDKNR